MRPICYWSALLGASLFGLAIWLALPSMVVVIDDDFGYLKSVVGTLKRGKPWTDEWLAPWAASMSVLAALLFKATKSFQFAVQFSLALSAALSCLGLSLFLQKCGCVRWRSVFIAWLVLCSPTVLFMLLMFTSVALYMGCLWLCIVLAGCGRWWWFLAAWTVGIAARQSAVVWIALPAWAVLTHLWRTRSWLPKERAVWMEVAVIGVGACVMLALKFGMNRTHSQDVAYGAMSHLSAWAPGNKAIALGGLALVAGLGSGCLATVFGLRGDAPGTVASSRPGWLWWLLLLLLAAAGVGGAQWFWANIVSTHRCYNDSLAGAFFLVAGLASALGLAFRPVVPRWDFLLAGLGAWALLAIYGGVFDYYFIDTFFWGFAAAAAGARFMSQGREVAGSRTRNFTRLSGRVSAAALMVLIALWDGRCYVRMKLEQDRVAGYIQLYEKALRSGALKPGEVGHEPFGYIGWLFHDYYLAHGGDHSPDIGGFIRYTDPWDEKRGTGVLTTYDPALRPYRDWLPTHNNSALMRCEEAVTIAEYKAPVLWFHKAKYILKRLNGNDHPKEQPAIDAEEYAPVQFPLDDSEWRRLAQ